MSLRYGFFDSEITGYDEEGMPIFDRAESSDFLALFISKIISNGVLALPGDCFQVMAQDGMTLKVRPGFGVIQGRFAYDTQDFNVTLSNAPTGYKRVDRVVLRANYLERLCEVIVKAGNPDANPEPPELLQPASGDYYELSLATVTVNSNQTVITQSDITDTRYDSRVCGVVTQAIDHIETDVFYAQFNRFYKEFVERADETYKEFVNSSSDYLESLKNRGEEEFVQVVSLLQSFQTEAEKNYNVWFQHMKDQLSEDAAGSLQLQIDTLTQSIFERYYGLVAQNTEFMPDGSIVQDNAEATVTTVFGTDENENRKITQTVTVKRTLLQFVKVTTIYPATENSNKRIVEAYEVPMTAVYLDDMLMPSAGGTMGAVSINSIGTGLDLSDDGTLSVDVGSVAEKVTESMTDFEEKEVEEIYDAAERAEI